MSFPETKFGPVLEVLSKGQIRFIVIGGLAAMAQGNARSRYDVDVVYSRERDNIRRLADVVGRLVWRGDWSRHLRTTIAAFGRNGLVRGEVPLRDS